MLTWCTVCRCVQYAFLVTSVVQFAGGVVVFFGLLSSPKEVGKENGAQVPMFHITVWDEIFISDCVFVLLHGSYLCVFNRTTQDYVYFKLTLFSRKPFWTFVTLKSGKRKLLRVWLPKLFDFLWVRFEHGVGDCTRPGGDGHRKPPASDERRGGRGGSV